MIPSEPRRVSFYKKTQRLIAAPAWVALPADRMAPSRRRGAALGHREVSDHRENSDHLEVLDHREEDVPASDLQAIAPRGSGLRMAALPG